MRVIPEVTLSWLYTVLRFPARLGYPAGAVAELVVNAGHIGAPGPFEFLHHNDGKNGIHRLRALSSSWTTLTAASKPWNGRAARAPSTRRSDNGRAHNHSSAE